MPHEAITAKPSKVVLLVLKVPMRGKAMIRPVWQPYTCSECQTR
ncbi:MAG: hypothetical protein JWN34_3714 [Bryobacterales bacterium]|nr:hypothetical protein [Bryobacterales bacterium]